jgi:hypothetical protein
MLWKYTERLKHINQLIRTKATGCPKELAAKLGLTERAWYKLRDELINDLNLPISYCPIIRSYYYKEEGSFEIGFKKLTEDRTTDISGGNKYLKNYQHCTFSSVPYFSFTFNL